MTAGMEAAPELALGDAEFLDHIQKRLMLWQPTMTVEEIARLRALAKWADTYLPPTGTLTVDRKEVGSAIDAARAKLRQELPRA